MKEIKGDIPSSTRYGFLEATKLGHLGKLSPSLGIFLTFHLTLYYLVNILRQQCIPVRFTTSNLLYKLHSVLLLTFKDLCSTQSKGYFLELQNYLLEIDFSMVISLDKAQSKY